jgi:hypothetical protein
MQLLYRYSEINQAAVAAIIRALGVVVGAVYKVGLYNLNAVDP